MVLNEFLTGSRYVLAGLNLITKPGIRLYVLVPLLVNTLLFACVIVYGANQLSVFIDWLSARWAWMDWLSWVIWPFFVFISLTIVFFCFSILANLISAPFNSFLARAVESKLTEIDTYENSSLAELPIEIIAAFKSEAGKFGYFLLWGLPLLALFIIPIVQAVAPIIWFIFGAWMIALEYMEFPMGNNDMHFPQIRQTLATKRELAFGFGSGVLLLTMTPVFNFIAMPVAVAGATQLWTDRFKNLKHSSPHFSPAGENAS